jgi:hypothetical protein
MHVAENIFGYVTHGVVTVGGGRACAGNGCTAATGV